MVVVHPPFRWQRDYARGFVEGIALLEERTGIAIAVENMYPWRASPPRDAGLRPALGPGRASTTRTRRSTSRTPRPPGPTPLELARRAGRRLRHLHLTDGSGSAKDEHLIPGRGSQPTAALLEHLAGSGFAGHVVLEVNTRRSGSRAARESDLMEGLAYARLHFAAALAGQEAAGRSRRREPGPPVEVRDLRVVRGGRVGGRRRLVHGPGR